MKTSGLVASISTLPVRFCAPAIRSAFSVPLHKVHRTASSANCAASAKLPVDAAGPVSAAQALAFALFASRDPIFT